MYPIQKTRALVCLHLLFYFSIPRNALTMTVYCTHETKGAEQTILQTYHAKVITTYYTVNFTKY